jgi:hypothetical protein
VAQAVINRQTLEVRELQVEILLLIQLLDKSLQKAEEEAMAQEDLVVDLEEVPHVCLVMPFKVAKQEFQELMVLVLEVHQCHLQQVMVVHD